MLGPHREFTGPFSFEITVLTDLLVKMWTFSLIWGPQREFSGPTSFEHIHLPDLLDEMRIFSQIWGVMALVIFLLLFFFNQRNNQLRPLGYVVITYFW